MKEIFLAVALLVATSAFGQAVEHAPTAAQCQADSALWTKKMTDPADSWALSAKDVSMRTLTKWGTEMTDCTTVDPPNTNRYVATQKFILLIRGARLQDFVIRHDLAVKFLDEDEAGAR